ncbi:MAG: pilus assembly protein [Anaerolineales bacterium]|nr:pilus assembly protein [Anaerolineales bacterium]
MIKNKPTYSTKTERGQSLTELAISLMLLLLLLAGTIDFGLAFFEYIMLRDAAQEGAIYAAMNPIQNDGSLNRVLIEKRVEQASNAVIVQNADVDVIPSGALCEGNSITIRVAAEHPIVMPLMAQFTGPTISLTAEVTQTILLPVCPTGP